MSNLIVPSESCMCLCCGDTFDFSKLEHVDYENDLNVSAVDRVSPCCKESYILVKDIEERTYL